MKEDISNQWATGGITEDTSNQMTTGRTTEGIPEYMVRGKGLLFSAGCWNAASSYFVDQLLITGPPLVPSSQLVAGPMSVTVRPLVVSPLLSVDPLTGSR